MDLEAQNQALQTELNSATPTSSNRRGDPASWLPAGPPRHVLQSHRTPINCVAFHPIFSSIASGDEDATIKIWDWEFGELERTVKGHTKAVLDLDYGGPKGLVLLSGGRIESILSKTELRPQGIGAILQVICGEVGDDGFMPAARSDRQIISSRSSSVRTAPQPAGSSTSGS